MIQKKKIILFTKEGHAKKLTELESLQKKRLPAVNELQYARDQGDRSENGAYKAARWKLSGIDSQIRRLNAILRQAQVVEKPADSKIGMGSSIVVIWNGEEKKFTLVGQEESDLSDGKLSVVSPVGRALVGKQAGDLVNIYVPAGQLTIQVKSVT